MCANVMVLMATVVDDFLMTVDIWASLRDRIAQLDSGGLVEPLTDRELLTLRYLRGHQSLAEIAGMLHVSRNTTKTHVKNIYRKLGVGCRREAVKRSHSLSLP